MSHNTLPGCQRAVFELMLFLCLDPLEVLNLKESETCWQYNYLTYLIGVLRVSSALFSLWGNLTWQGSSYALSMLLSGAGKRNQKS